MVRMMPGVVEAAAAMAAGVRDGVLERLTAERDGVARVDAVVEAAEADFEDGKVRIGAVFVLTTCEEIEGRLSEIVAVVTFSGRTSRNRVADCDTG